MKILVEQKILVPAGVRLLLNDEQLDARRHNLAIDDEGVAMVTTPMEFKAGEVLEVVGELPIAIPAAHYDIYEGEPVKQPAKAKAKDKAKTSQPILLAKKKLIPRQPITLATNQELNNHG